MMRKLRFRKLPEVAKLLLINHNAWLVGSTAGWYLSDEETEYTDVDLIVPPSQWLLVSRIIKMMFGDEVTLNSFGGLKLNEEGIEIDVWPMTLDDFLPPTNDPEYCVRLKPPAVVKTGKSAGL